MPWLQALLVFLILAPILPSYEFANGIEELHVATVMEMRRGGPWLVPTLNNRPRIAKPPLPAWIGGLCVSDATMAGVASNDPAVRAAGYTRLAWEIRWPALLAACLMLVAVADLGTTLGRSRRVGLIAAIVAASCYLFLNQVRIASTDVHLALWVTTANALLARAIFRRQRWLGCVGGGAALGLGLMCKGPVALLQTIVPLAVWWGWMKWRQRRRRLSNQSVSQERPPASSTAGASEERADAIAPVRSKWLLPSVCGAIAVLLIALPWPILVLAAPLPTARPGEPPPRSVAKLWWAEITREGATDHDYDSVFTYLNLLPNLLPWLPAFIAGIWLLERSKLRTTIHFGGSLRRRRTTQLSTATPSPTQRFSSVEDSTAPTPAPLDYASSASADGPRKRVERRTHNAHPCYLLAFFWLVVPILIMSLPRDKQDRYLLPMLAPAAVITARGLLAFSAGVRRGRTDAGVWLAIPLGIIAAIAVAAPILGRFPGLLVRKIDGGPWFELLPAAIALVLAVLVSIAIFHFARRRQPGRAIAIAGFMVVAVAAFGNWGYRDSVGGRDEMKPIAERIRTLRTGATVGYYDPRKDSKPLPPDLSIYMNQAIPTLKHGAPEKPGPQSENAMPDVIVVLQRENESPPTVPGWRTIATEPYRKRFWHAMVRE